MRTILCDKCNQEINSKSGYIIFKELKMKENTKYSYTHKQLGMCCYKCYNKFLGEKLK